MNGKIIKIVSNLYTVSCDGVLYECQARGKFRSEKITPLVGDECEIDAQNNYILKIHPRQNSLDRPLIANVDVALIVTSVKKPNLSLNLLDKMLSIIIINKIKPVICFTKMDLLNSSEKKEIKKIAKYYQKIGIDVVYNNKINKLMKILRNKIVVFTGQTGAGKSSLLNKIDKNLNLKTSEISEALGRGKHTTRHVELFKVKNTLIADTPGFSALDINKYPNEEIRDSFLEFSKYHCQFKDCFHLKEKNCEIKKMVEAHKILESRYKNYQSFILGREIFK